MKMTRQKIVLATLISIFIGIPLLVGVFYMLKVMQPEITGIGDNDYVDHQEYVDSIGAQFLALEIRRKYLNGDKKLNVIMIDYEGAYNNDMLPLLKAELSGFVNFIGFIYYPQYVYNPPQNLSPTIEGKNVHYPVEFSFERFEEDILNYDLDGQKPDMIISFCGVPFELTKKIKKKYGAPIIVGYESNQYGRGELSKKVGIVNMAINNKYYHDGQDALRNMDDKAAFEQLFQIIYQDND